MQSKLNAVATRLEQERVSAGCSSFKLGYHVALRMHGCRCSPAARRFPTIFSAAVIRDLYFVTVTQESAETMAMLAVERSLVSLPALRLAALAVVDMTVTVMCEFRTRAYVSVLQVDVVQVELAAIAAKLELERVSFGVCVVANGT